MNQSPLSLSEVRFGNLVQFVTCVEENKNRLVICLGKPRPFEAVDFSTPKVFYGIPLTEEWLLKFGFEPTQDSDCFKSPAYFHIVFEVNFFKNPDQIYIDLCCLPDHNSPHEYEKCIELAGEYKYVHQLQNLYFIHTGKELTIKELINA